MWTTFNNKKKRDKKNNAESHFDDAGVKRLYWILYILKIRDGDIHNEI